MHVCVRYVSRGRHMTTMTRDNGRTQSEKEKRDKERARERERGEGENMGRWTLEIGGREDVQFLSHLPKYTIAYDQHFARDILHGGRVSNVQLRYSQPHINTHVLSRPTTCRKSSPTTCCRLSILTTSVVTRNDENFFYQDAREHKMIIVLAQL